MYSAVMVSCTTSKKQKKFLRIVDELGMSSGDYVFILPYTFVVPDDLPLDCSTNATLPSSDDYCDSRTLNSLRSALVIQPTFPKWEKFAETMKDVLVRRKELYNLTDHDIETYDTHYTELSRTRKISGRRFRDYFTNSTFTFASQKVQYANALRVSTIQILQFDWDSSDSQVILEINSLRPTNLTRMEYVPVWLRGNPPPDRPLCGLLNELCADQSATYTAVGSAGGVLILISITVTIVVQCIRRLGRTVNDAFSWWTIQTEEIDFSDRRASLMVQRPMPTAAAAFADRLIGLRGSPCWATWVDCTTKGSADEFATPRMIKLMDMVRSLRHDNINPFVGIHLFKPCCIVEEYCPRGSVADVFADEHPLDRDMKISAVIDLIRGLHYIHTSSLHFHGNLRSTKCLFTKLLSLRIGDCSNERLKPILKPVEHKYSPSSPWKLLWTPPEILRGTRLRSAATDVYAMGVIMHEIVFQNGPFSLGAVDQISVEAATGKTYSMEYRQIA
ncbi:receptor-type guanylate cyclase Gyc76C-like [Paramacrobiotus metropolitanus]|uniref:receptor-type guanylate cyclase Gyc76C-like n=1 Tax=Paramacrobiotus metropolitanus TaxID=2943436 RepID=UPI002445DC95|nr:receptor-type guanylate cyclase Gyc76C-like [Paramacrobiotus metropolitanus]